MGKTLNIIHIQPALPRYRMDFFERLSHLYGPAMRVYYSPGSLGVLTRPVAADWAISVGSIRSLPAGLAWQSGVSGLCIQSGDIVVLSGNPRQLSTLVLLARARLLGARVVWWGHYWSSTSRRWRQILRHLPMAMANAILFYTDDEIAAFRTDVARIGKNRIVAALNNGIDIEPIRPLRRPYRAVDRERALLFIGRISEKAKLNLGLEAIAYLGEYAPVLHVIGEGNQKEALQARADELALDSKVVWHGAMTEETEIAALANRCQAFLYPGEVGLSLVHAMAYGLPAIVHDQSRLHMPEIAAFRDGENGLTFAHDDVRSLAKAIDRVLSDSVELDRLSAGAARVVGPNYTTESMAARFEALIDQLEGKE